MTETIESAVRGRESNLVHGCRLNPGAQKALNELREDARLCKNRHFSAAERKHKYHIYCGLPIMTITVFTGTIFVSLASSNEPPKWLATVAAVLAFVSAMISGFQTFFNFHRMAEGHRAVANRYQEIARRCKHLMQQEEDVEISATAMWEQIEDLRVEYARINEEAEAFPTSSSDFNRAKDKTSYTPFQAPHPPESRLGIAGKPTDA